MNRRIFPDLAPPPGGLARLQARIHRRPLSARALSLAVVPSLVAAAALVVVLVRPPALPRLPLPTTPALLEGAPAPGPSVALADGATLYWVPTR